jgi:hypothetical protein
MEVRPNPVRSQTSEILKARSFGIGTSALISVLRQHEANVATADGALQSRDNEGAQLGLTPELRVEDEPFDVSADPR